MNTPATENTPVVITQYEALQADIAIAEVMGFGDAGDMFNAIQRGEIPFVTTELKEAP